MSTNLDKSFSSSSPFNAGFEDVEVMRQKLAARTFSKMLEPIQDELDRGDADRFALGELLGTLCLPQNREHMGKFPGHDDLYAIADRMMADYRRRHPAASPATKGGE